MKKKSVTILFLGNINIDTRTSNMVSSLRGLGHKVNFIGFDWMTPHFRTINENGAHVYRLNKTRISVFFYIAFYFKSVLFLLEHPAEIYLASDLYALPVCAFFARIRHKRLFYDSREIYVELAGIQKKSVIKRLIALIERIFIKYANVVIVTGKMDGEWLKNKYGLHNFTLLRNLPRYQKIHEPVDLHKELNIPKTHFLILYQGIIAPGRGIEAVIKALPRLKNAAFILIGWGEYEDYYRKYAASLNISDKVYFAGKVSQDKLLSYTAGADTGVCLIENISLSYFFALPNKLFEYIMAGLPVLSTQLPQMAHIINTYHAGAVIEESNIEKLTDIISLWQKNKELFKEMQLNCAKAAEILHWDNEFENIKKIFGK